MKSRFSTVAGFLAAATLLSGSAFAFAPEFQGDLPTVIISDRISGSFATSPFDYGTDVTETNFPLEAWGGSFRSSSAFFFRYDDAIDLDPYIQLNDAASLADIRVAFVEYDNETDMTPNATTTLTINGADALTVEPDPLNFSDFDQAGQYFTADQLLSFRNIDFSPVGGATSSPNAFDPIGDVTGQDLEVSSTQERVVSLFITTADATVADSGYSESFIVITAADDGGDRLSEAVISDVFTEPVWDNGGNFDFWHLSLYDPSIFGIPATGDLGTISTFAPDILFSSPDSSGTTIVPASPVDSASPAGVSANDNVAVSTTAPLEVSTSNAQYGLYGWGLDTNNTEDDLGPEATSGLTLDAGKLYRLRASISSPTTSSSEAVYIQFGGASTVSSGFNSQAPYPAPSTKSFPEPSTTADTFEMYLLPRAAAATPLVSFGIVDLSNTNGQDLVIHDLEITAASGLGALENGTVVFNQGAATFALASGESAPSNDNRVDFSIGTGVSPQDPLNTPGVDWYLNASNPGLSSAVNESLTGTATVINAQTSLASGSSSPNIYWEFYQASLSNVGNLDLDAHDGGTVEVSPDKIYVTEVFASTANVGAVMPNLYIRNTVDLTNFTGTLHQVTPGTFSATPAENLLASDAKQFTNIWRPDTPQALGEFYMDLGFIYTGLDTLATSTIRIHRVVITEYDAYNP